MKLIKGNFIYSIDKDNIEIKENQYLLIKDGKAEEFYKELIIYIKWRLMTDLIKRGYYINICTMFYGMRSGGC